MTAKDLINLLKENKISIGSVESFTGGLFASEITKVGGASKVFKGSVVTYATELKNTIVGVEQETINKFGVVSKEVAYQMAEKGRTLLGVDCCVSFTGNAGPTAMDNKPVGEIYIGVSFKNQTFVTKYNLMGDRNFIQSQAVLTAYDLISEHLMQKFS